jgi:tetratricopeptide (TPR) repeat protein
MKIRDVLIRLIGAKASNCPNDADILTYSERRLSAKRRAEFERHFAKCDDCRQVLAFLGQEADEALAPLAPFTDEVVSAQTKRILAYIENDEARQTGPSKKHRAPSGFYISYPKLAAVALVMCAIAIAGVFLFIRPQATADAMDALRLAVKDVRYTEARISGGFDHSRYAQKTRGGDRNIDDLYFSRAENKAKAAAQATAAAKDRLVLARVHLSRGTREDARQALAILDQLSKTGIETPEALNDTGVAQFELDNYDEAIANFTKALEKSPRYDEALFNRALAEGRAHRDAEARQDWRQFLNQSSDESWKTEAETHLQSLPVEH